MEYKVVRKQENSRDCVVCGLENAGGLHASFYELENNDWCNGGTSATIQKNRAP